MSSQHEILDRDILPRVFSSLDSVFPEFGFKRSRGGWVATNSKFTKAQFGARADRCVVKQESGVLVYGDRGYHWLEYLAGGVFPSGANWWRTVAELGARVGVAVVAPGPSSSRSRMVLELERMLVRTASVDAYLASRGATIPDGVDVGELPGEPSELLRRAGFTESDVRRAGIVRDTRWQGRVVCAWREVSGEATSLWGRAVDDDDDVKYLVLAGGSPVLFGADDALWRARRAGGAGIVVVEGMFDQLGLRSVGVPAAGVGRAGLTVDAIRVLEAAGSATLFLDADGPGSVGTRRAIETWAQLHSPLRLSVAGSQDKDPDKLVQRGGRAAVDEALSRREPAAVAYVSARLAGAPEVDQLKTVQQLLGFLGDVAVCHPLEAGRATDVLAAKGYSRAMLQELSGQLDLVQLKSLRAAAAARLSRLDAQISALEAE